MKQTIFVVEDDADIARLVRYHLESSEFAVRVFSSSTGVLRQAEADPPSLFLLDIMIPGGNGLDLCREIRQSQTLSKSPVIFLTAKTSEPDRIAGLDLGADDYILKPFSPREMVARVKAVLRRFDRVLPHSILRHGEVEIDTGAMTLKIKGRPVGTTATEFRLLEYLARHAGRVFTRDQLLDAVWRETAFVTPRSVDVYVRRLREKIERDPESPQLLKTVRGAGYRFEAPR